MTFTLFKALPEHKEVIKNLMQFYIYDFSEYVKYDVEDDGLFKAYPGLEEYWKDENHKFSYLVKKDEKYVGFVLIRLIESAQSTHFSVAEFFILKKYRREGIGKAAAKQVFDLHRGYWQIYQKENNIPAQLFWNNVINEYTNGRFEDRSENGRRIQNFQN